jgi:HlyD family secretion protein
MTARTRIVTVIIGVFVVAASLVAARARSAPAQGAAAAATPSASGRIVGPGRIEPISEEIHIGVEVGGRIARVHVEEGDRVTAGQVLATLENGDYRAAVASAAARLDDAKAVLLRVRTGARPDERREVTAAVAQAEAVLAQATVEATRRAGLAADGVIAREESDRAARDRAVAAARLQEVQARRTLVHDGPRAEDHAQAAAAVAVAAAALREAEARLAKTDIRSPIDGVVLRRDARTGESVSPDRQAVALFTVADVSRLRVRVEVDETDVGRVAAGAPGWVSASAFGDRRFPGHVIRVGQSLGRKQLFTEEPRERVDTKVLEVLLELEPGARLPIGLRVDATIETPVETRR